MKKSKKLIGIIAAIVAVVAAMLIAVACEDDGGSPKNKKYTLSFETFGGTAIAPITAEAGSNITPPQDPEKEGYTFEGWYLNANLMGSSVQIPTVMPSSNITYYANYVENGVKVIYVFNLGNVYHDADIAPSVGEPDTTVTVKDGADFGATGYMFVGWSINPTGEVAITGEKKAGQYNPGDEIPLGESDVVLYAQWAREYTDARQISEDKIYVYNPLIGHGLGAATLVRKGKPDKLGFVASKEDSGSGFMEFTFYFEESEGGEVTGRLYDDFTYAYASGDGTRMFLYYDHVTQSEQNYILAVDEYDFATLNEVVGNQTAVRAYGYYAYNADYNDYTFVYMDSYGEEGTSYFMLDERIIVGTEFNGYFTFQGFESGSYLWYDNGEMLNYRLDLNGYGSARLYSYDAITERTELVGTGAYHGTELYEDYYGEWQFEATDGDAYDFKFVLNELYLGTDIVPVYIEYNPDYDLTLNAAVGDGTLILNGYGVAIYREGGMEYIGNCTVLGENVKFIPAEINGEAVENPTTMYFNIDFDALTFTVNVEGFIIDNGVLTAYRGESQIVVIPDEVTEIAADAFNYTRSESETSLISVTVPASVTKIGDRAFQNNYTLLRAVFLSETPAEVESWDMTVNPFRWPAGGFIIVVPEGSQAAYKAAWAGCPYDIKGSFEVSQLPEFEIEDGVLVRYNKQEGSADLLDLTIPSEVTEIADRVFLGMSFIRSVDLNNVVTVGADAFSACENLVEVVLTNVKTVGEGAFSDCIRLSTSGVPGILELPAVVTIEAYAFQGCESLVRVMLGENLGEIGDYAFYEVQIYAGDPPLFIELLGTEAPIMGYRVTVGNIAVRIQVVDISVVLKCYEEPTWSMYNKHLYIQSGEEKGKYFSGIDLLELDGRAELQSSYLFMYEIDGTTITFYEFDSDTREVFIYSGTIADGVITVRLGVTDYVFEKANGPRTYTTADGAYTLVVDPIALLPESYEDYTGYADATLNGNKVSIYILGYNTKTIKNYVDTDGKKYNLSLSFEGNTLVVTKRLADGYVRDIRCETDDSVLNLHYSGSLVYVFGTMYIDDIDNGITFGDYGTIATMLSDTEFTFIRDWKSTKYYITVTLSDDYTTFTYTYTKA
ncbi:MAG: leucine-rich repeat protein [Clostridiales bacterium]|nr:leucine-rich repeat protein [Clostridiales bacterium]